MLTKIKVDGRQLDMNQEVDLRFNFGIQNYKDLSAKKNTWSYSFEIPCTETNELILQNYSDYLNYSDFNPYTVKNVDIEVEGVNVIFDGNIRIQGVVYINNKKNYRVNIQGPIGSIIDQFGEDMITDIDFSELDHDCSRQNIERSWQSGNTIFQWQSGYTYPILDNGFAGEVLFKYWMQLKTIYPENFIPCLSVRYILEKIFEGKEYTFTSDSFFNNTEFTQTVIPFTGDVDDWVSTGETCVGHLHYGVHYNPASIANFWNNIFDGFTIDYNNYNWTKTTTDSNQLRYSFKCDQTSDYKITVSVGDVYDPRTTGADWISFRQYEKDALWNITISDPHYVSSAQFTNSTPVIVDDIYGDPCSEVVYDNSIAYDNKTWSWTVTLEKDKLYYLSSGSDYKDHFVYFTGLTFQIDDMINRRETSNVIVNKIVPQLTQREFVLDTLSSYNLFFYQPTGGTNKQLKFMTRNDYFANPTVLDWTDKLLTNYEYTVEPLNTSLQGTLTWATKNDNDYESKKYTDTYSQDYDFRKVIVDQNLTTKQDFKSIFSSTPLGLVRGYSNMFTSQMYDVDTDNMSKRKRSSPLKRLFYKWRSLGSEFWLWQKSISSPTTTTYNSYPYCGHIYDPTLSGNTNYSTHFTDPLNSSGVVTGKGLYNTYHRKYVDNLKHKHCHVFTGIFKINSKDMSDLINVDRPLHQSILLHGNVYNIDSIEGWNPSTGEAKVKLIRQVIGYSDCVPDGVNGYGGLLSGYTYEIQDSEHYMTAYGWEVFDKNVNTNWVVNNPSWTSGGELAILSWMFKEDFKIETFEIVSSSGNQPTSFSLLAYDGKNFVSLYTVSNYSWGSNTSKIFQCSNVGYYKVYMLQITKANSSYMTINNLYLNERLY